MASKLLLPWLHALCNREATQLYDQTMSISVLLRHLTNSKHPTRRFHARHASVCYCVSGIENWKFFRWSRLSWKSLHGPGKPQESNKLKWYTFPVLGAEDVVSLRRESAYVVIAQSLTMDSDILWSSQIISQKYVTYETTTKEENGWRWQNYNQKKLWFTNGSNV